MDANPPDHPDAPALPPDLLARREAARAWIPPSFAPPDAAEYNRLDLDYRRPLPRPAVDRPVIDCHTHLLSAAHADDWFAAADHYGIDHTITMTPLEEVEKLTSGPYASRLTFIAVPEWAPGAYDEDRFWQRVDAYRNLGVKVVKFHLAPGTMIKSNLALGSDKLRRYVDMAIEREMIVMTHIGDPETWYAHPQRYGGDPEFFGTREQHYDAWEALLDATRGYPWWGAHLGGNPEDPVRLGKLLDTYPDLMLDLSATRWMVREVSRNRDVMRDFVIRYQDRLMWGSDQVSYDGRGFDFLASRWWSHRKLWETAYNDQSNISDPDVTDGPPMLRGLALPDDVLQKLYRDNIVQFLQRVGVQIGAVATD